MDKDSLRALAQCPVCLDVRKDVPIYQCANGHIICGPCKDSLGSNGGAGEADACPTSRCPFDVPPRRNR